jgi:ubiquinone biosynthesis protein
MRSGATLALRAAGLIQLGELARLALALWRSRAAPLSTTGAPLVARTLGRLKGPFAKLGQFAALRVDVLDPDARRALLALRDAVPPLPGGWLRARVERELGAPLEARFASFEPTVLGSASIAQVHAATLPDGREVAVKVQYPWLRASARADLGLARFALRAAARIVPNAASWREFARGYREELDFTREAASAAEIAANLAAEPRVVVPSLVASHSSRRVLTLERHPTLPLEREGLLARGIAPAAVFEIVVRAYARQLFLDGVFHADPHPGNLLVLDEPTSRESPRVLFVDFGLARRLDAALARELRAGILALLRNDLAGFLSGMQRMGMVRPGAEAGVRASVDAMFARVRGAAPGGALSLSGDRLLALKEEAQALLSATPGLVLPEELLLYAKTLSTLFVLGRELAPEVEVLKVAAPYLLRFLGDASARAASG